MVKTLETIVYILIVVNETKRAGIGERRQRAPANLVQIFTSMGFRTEGEGEGIRVGTEERKI